MEVDEQIALFEWAEYMTGKYPCLKWMHAIPNGGSRHKAEAARLKKQGVKAGIADIFLPFPSGQYHGLYIEMKYGKGKLSEKQAEFIQFAKSVGFKAEVCWSMLEAVKVILSYLEKSN